jgi:GNAT superfamily N-acetyltransferase
MEFAVLGWPPDGPTLDLDHREFAYAGKFVMADTGKAVARSAGTVVAAAAFSPDRTDPASLRCRYITVRQDKRGEGIGPRLLRFVLERAFERGFEDGIIAVNNPYAYIAAYRAGFTFAGEETGVAETVLEAGGPRDVELYRDGLLTVAARDLADEVEAFVERRLESPVPDVVEAPDDARPTED